ncbi:MAG: endonuclease III [Phycisphaerales bacterium JB064]
MTDRTPDNPQGLRDLPFQVPKVTKAQKDRARSVAEALAERYPDAVCALEYSTPHELLIATILSAQSTDAGVNKATPALFKAFPKPQDYADSTPEKIEKYIKSIGLYRNKAKSIHAAMTSVVEDFGGQVPRTMDELLTLRGVARKTASVVLGNAFGINEGFVVDTHIERLAKRFGLAPQDATVPMVERYLIALFPRDQWADLSHRIIYHGRQVCKARGWLCEGDSICQRFCENARSGRQAGIVKG